MELVLKGRVKGSVRTIVKIKAQNAESTGNSEITVSSSVRLAC